MKIAFKNIVIDFWWIGIKQGVLDIQSGRTKFTKIYHIFFYVFKACPCRTCKKEFNNKLGNGLGFAFAGCGGVYIAYTRELRKNELIIREFGKLPYIAKIQKILIC